MPANFSANLHSDFLFANFSALFLQGFSPPPPPNARPDKLLAFLSNFTFSNFTPIFCLLGISRFAQHQAFENVQNLGMKKTMTMTKITSRKPSGTYGHGPLKMCFWKGKDDDHDQDFLKKDSLHIWSWSSDKSSSELLPLSAGFCVDVLCLSALTTLRVQTLDTTTPSLPVLFVSNERHHFATLYDTILHDFV